MALYAETPPRRLNASLDERLQIEKIIAIYFFVFIFL